MKNRKPRLVVEFSDSITRVTAKHFVSRVTPRIKDVSELILLINSTGGSVELAYALAQFLTKIEGPVVTYNIGMCASAAVMVFAAGEKRFVRKNAIFHVHEVATKGSGDANLQSRDLDAWNQKIARYLQSRTGRHAASWRKNMKCTRRICPTEAVRMGLATKIESFRRRLSDIVVVMSD